MDIKKRLESIYKKERIVFWYDDKGELKEEFKELRLEDVEKRVIDDNEFSLKREMIKLKPKQKFLVYSSKKLPKDEDNWLLDLNLANYLFSADKISLALQVLGLGVDKKAFFSHFGKFLNAKSRVEALSKKLTGDEDENRYILKMISVAINTQESIESIVWKLFEDEKSEQVLQKYDLKGEFFKILKKRYGYSGESLDDLLYKLLQNHFYNYIDGSKCQLNSDARVFVSNWMDSSKHKESFARLSQKVSKELNISQVLENYSIEKLHECDTYEECEQTVISYLLDTLFKENIDIDNILQVVKIRQKSFWYNDYVNIYQAIKNAALLMDFVSKEKFDIKDMADGIKKYAHIWHKADLYYRNYTIQASNAEKIDVLKELSKRIENIYLNGFLRELNDTWQKFVEGYDISLFGNHQQNFYKRFITPMVEKNKKIFVIISDALRYECGVELSKKILQENRKKDRFSSSCDYLAGSLPSYTQLGMASLLPHKKLAIKDKNDTVFIDEISSAGLQNRNKILKSYDKKSVAIGYEEFLGYERLEGREFAKNHNIIYIYHDEIDKMGEKNEIKTFEAVASTFETLIKIIKQIANFNGVNIFITSDHGFIFTAKPTFESEFCRYESSGAVKTNRRFVIGKNLSSSTCVTLYDANKLGLQSDNLFAIAKSINKIRVQGGGNRFVHGGATLQEIVLPLLKVNIGKGKQEIKEVDVQISPIRHITTNSVNVLFYQTTPVDEKTKPLTLKIAFESKDGKVLSDETKWTFDSDEQYDTNRQKHIKLTFKQDIKEFNNQIVKLVARKVLPNSSEMPIYKEMDVKLRLSFFNDFGEDF